MIQVVLTPVAGKRLIAKGMKKYPAIREALRSGTVVIIAGTTNGYVAEELLKETGQAGDFEREKFFRGIVLPPAGEEGEAGKKVAENVLAGDVILEKGRWIRGKTIFDVVDDLREGDVILKGANALDLLHRRTAVHVSSPVGGTIVAALRAVIGRRVRLIVPVGLEKRVPGDLEELAARVNAPGTEGPRLLPLPGEVFTELEAIEVLSGATAEIISAGGVLGAEGAVRLAVGGGPAKEKRAREVLTPLLEEPPFRLT